MGRTSDDRQSPFRFIWNQSNAIAANVYLMLYPKPDIEERVREDGNVQESLFRCLQSICIESLVGEGRVYGGGLHKVEPKELAKVHVDLP
jgi:adenine-specific DNA-methyltransferase